jgi:hypothetical protein
MNKNPANQWPPGKSGNPKGAPPKARRLTHTLELAIGRTQNIDGKSVSGRTLLANIMRDLALYGRATLPDGRTMDIEPRLQIDLMQFLFDQIDGPPPPPPQQHEHSGAFTLQIIRDEPNTHAETVPDAR